jgi:hypothetical protein
MARACCDFVESGDSQIRLNVIRTGKSSASHLVFPEHLKYDQTQKAPYTALLDRLKTFLSTDDTLLISIGFSYADAHIAARIDEGLTGQRLGKRLCIYVQESG